jgi:hypothetical protein
MPSCISNMYADGLSSRTESVLTWTSLPGTTAHAPSSMMEAEEETEDPPEVVAVLQPPVKAMASRADWTSLDLRANS